MLMLMLMLMHIPRGTHLSNVACHFPRTAIRTSCSHAERSTRERMIRTSREDERMGPCSIADASVANRQIVSRCLGVVSHSRSPHSMSSSHARCCCITCLCVCHLLMRLMLLDCSALVILQRRHTHDQLATNTTTKEGDTYTCTWHIQMQAPDREVMRHFVTAFSHSSRHSTVSAHPPDSHASVCNEKGRAL